MKKILVLLLLAVQTVLIAQNADVAMRKINAHYIYSSVGTNISVGYQFRYKRIEPFAGLMYHINRSVNDQRSYAYRHRFYHRNFVDGIGVNFGLARPLRIGKSDIGLYLLYAGQVSHMHYRQLLSFFTLSRGLYYGYQYSPSQMWIVENNFGVGINVRLYDQFFLNASVAGGVGLYMVNNQYTDHEFFAEWEFSDHYRIGISYVLPNRAKAQ